jgi:hypothetical protein
MPGEQEQVRTAVSLPNLRNAFGQKTNVAITHAKLREPAVLSPVFGAQPVLN